MFQLPKQSNRTYGPRERWKHAYATICRMLRRSKDAIDKYLCQKEYSHLFSKLIATSGMEPSDMCSIDLVTWLISKCLKKPFNVPMLGTGLHFRSTVREHIWACHRHEACGTRNALSMLPFLLPLKAFVAHNFRTLLKSLERGSTRLDIQEH